MKKLSTVTIMRRWNEPQILITVNNEAIELKMTMTDFQAAITDEICSRLQSDMASAIGSVTWTFKESTFQNRVNEAIQKVLPSAIDGAVSAALMAIKQESKKII